MDERQLVTYPTWERYTVLSVCIGKMSVRDRRRIFQLTRSVATTEHHNVFFPEYGFTLSEFAVWHLLGDRA